MFGIPLDLDLSFLIGSDIKEVCEFENQYVILKLNPEREIHIEGGRSLEGYIAPNQPVKFQDLEGKRIIAVKIPSTTELNLLLSESIRLRLFDDSTQYESIGIYPEAIII
jgi:hypothetical protein